MKARETLSSSDLAGCHKNGAWDQVGSGSAEIQLPALRDPFGFGTKRSAIDLPAKV
jgi:hypothetical protein